MVTGRQLKTGYWRINPATGEREWIAQSNQPPTPDVEEEEVEEVEVGEEAPVSPLITSREFFEFDEAMREFRPEQPTYAPLDLVGLEPVVPTPDVTELASLYGISPRRFVGRRQLEDLAKPPEERTVQWRIPYEQYLNVEQAKFLGFDVPEGSVVKMTPMAGAEPAFFLMTAPEAEKAPDEELVKRLRNIFPSMFDPVNSYGYSLEEIPGVVVDTLRNRLATDYQDFVLELNTLVSPQESEDLLRLFGVTEEHILQTLDFVDQEAHVNALINDVFPDFADAYALGRLVDDDFGLFMETMQTGGGTLEKRRLLELMGFEPVEINEIFSRQRMVVEVDDIRQLLTIDIENQAAYNARGDYVGGYNAATKRFTKDPQENIAKDFYDWTAFQSRTMWEQGENFLLSVMPEIIYAEIPANKADRDPLEKLFSEDMINSINENNRRMRENFRYLYGKNKEEYQKWVAKHPELIAPIAYQEGAFKHPELLQDYRYYAYELANIMPFIITATGMAVATGGVGLPAVIGTAAVMGPVEGQAVYEDLVNAGAPEDKAAQLAAVSGAVIGLLESAGRIPLLRQMSPLLFGAFKKKALSELSKRTLAETILKFGRNFTIVQFAEVSTEVAQEVVSNVAVGFYDENRSILENLPDIAVKTAVATLLPSGLAAGVSVRMVSPLEQSGLSEIQKKARGWLKDEKGNWFERAKEILRDERGFVRLPLEPEEVGLSVKENLPQITQEKLKPLAPLATRDDIWITGSVAMGTATEKSDLDVIIRVPDDVLKDAKKARKVEEEVNALVPSERNHVFFTSESEMSVDISTRKAYLSYERMTPVPSSVWENAKPIRQFFQEAEPTIPITEPTVESEIASWEKFRAELQEELKPLRGQARKDAESELSAVNFRIRKLREAPRVTTLSVEEISKYETRIPLDLIRKDEKEYLAKLTEQIKKEGIKEPITVRVRDDGSRILWDGIHRFIVAQDLGIKNVPIRFIGEEGEALGVKVSPELPTPPITEPGMPEAGVQPSMLPEDIAAREVRPPGRGRIVQISMEDQLKLEEYRQAAEAYEAETEVEGLKEFLATDPVARKRIQIAGKKVGLDFFISLREQEFPEYFTVKQAEQLYPQHSFAKYTEKGKKTYNKVPRDEALDDLTKEFGLSPDEIAERVMRIREAKRKVKAVKPPAREISKSVTETKPKDIVLSPSGERMLTPAQRTRTLEVFGNYVMGAKAIDAWALTEELRRETRTGQAEKLKARTQELMIQEGMPAEEAMRQAIKETLTGKLPVVETDYLDDLSDQMRNVLFQQVAEKMGDYPLEMAATYTALLNALPQRDEAGNLIRHARAIPRKKGPGSVLFPEGGSAWDRLNYVFGEQPQVMKALDKISEEGTTIEEVVEGIFHEIGRDYVPIDADMAEYLRTLSGIPFGYRTMMEPKFNIPVVQDLRTEGDLAFAIAELELGQQLADGRITFDEFQLKRMEARDKAYPLPPVAKYEAPIDKAIKELPLWPVPATDSIVRALKELGMAPIDIGNFLRANKASFDFSFWRQQAPLIASHPISFAMANVEAWKSIWSQKSAEASWSRITQDPLYQIYELCEEAGGDFLRPLILAKGTAQYRGTEEFGYARGVKRLLPRFTMWLPHVKISARAFETGTNEHNWLIFKSYYKAMLKLNEQYASGKKTLKPGQAFDIQKEMVDFSKSLANFTARGSLGRYQIAAPTLSAMFFAPRMSIGRILSVKDLINANPRVRAEAWKNAALFISTLGGIVLLGAMAGWWEVERDPRSAEYMSIRIGTTRVDPWGGFRQFLVFFVRAITRTGVSSVTGAEYKPDPLDLIQNLLRGKAAPLMALLLDFWKGRNFVGEEVDVANKKQWAERIAPFAPWDIYEAYREDPVTALEVAIPAIVGASVQTYTGDWIENFPKLGLPKYTDSLPYGVRTPYYTTEDFWADTASQFKDVDPETLTAAKGFPEYIRAIAEARAIKENLSTMPNEKLYAINADAAKGATFAQYYQMWREREALVATGDEEKLKEWDADERHNNVHLGNISQQQFSLLMEYHSITDEDEQAEFLEKHWSDIGINPRNNELATKPKENAQLAIWGQAELLSKAAYDEFLSLQKLLDIPDNGLPEMILPPEASADNYFEREAAVQEYGGMSAEAMIVLARDPDLLKWYQDEALKMGADALNKPPQPERYYELKIKNRSEREYMATLKDKDSLDYIDDPDERIAAFYKEFPDSEYFDDEMRTEAIANGFDDVQIEAWVERGRLVSQYSGGSPLVKQWAFDNPKAYEKALEESMLNDRGGLATEEERGHYDEWVEPAIRLQAKNVKEDAYWNELGDKTSPETYIDDMDKRRAAFFKQFPNSDYFNDMEKVEAYKGGFTDKEADLWADRGRLLGTVEPQSAEAKIWLVDHQDVFDKAVYGGLLTDDGSTWNVPALRITVKWRPQDEEYNAIDGDDAEARAAYLAANPEYRMDRRRRQAYQMKNKLTGATFPEEQIENFVAYNELEVKGKRQERFLIDNPEFAAAMHEVAGIDIPKPEDVPAIQYDNIYDENKDNFDRLEGLADNESEHYIVDEDEREEARNAMRFDNKGKYTAFGLAELRRNAYGKFVPEQYIENYVGYYTIIGEGKPENWKLDTGTDLWYADDWFLIENIEFYRDVYRDLLGNEKKDFTKVPSREVFNLYLDYLAQPHLKAKDDFRVANPALDAWLVIKFDFTPVSEKVRREGLTAYERFIEKWAERGAEIEERLKALRE